jgi:hypothetical protein
MNMDSMNYIMMQMEMFEWASNGKRKRNEGRKMKFLVSVFGILGLFLMVLKESFLLPQMKVML